MDKKELNTLVSMVNYMYKAYLQNDDEENRDILIDTVDDLLRYLNKERKV